LVKGVLPLQAVEERADLVKLWCLSGGFIVTSLLWGSALVALLDGRLRLSAAYLAVAAVCALFGIIHSPFPAERIALPYQVVEQLREQYKGDIAVMCQSPYHWTAAYLLSAGVLVGLSFFPSDRSKEGREEDHSAVSGE
jgi:AGZA family xanthine/uracil permease-like MFS transporter